MTEHAGEDEDDPGRIAQWPPYLVECLRCDPKGGKTVYARGAGPTNRPPQRYCEDGHPVDGTDGWYMTKPGEQSDFPLNPI